MNYQLILASNSPRRKSLLEELGLDFVVRTKSIDESYPQDLNPEKVPEYLARKKAHSYELNSNELLIAADTVVIEGQEILGKPADNSEARSILKRLSGKNHQVVTGVCIRSFDMEISFSVTTQVFFKKLEEAEINLYVQRFSPLDKAGGYGIQEWIGMIGIERIVGDYYNVVGLPLNSLWEALKKFNKKGS